MHNATARSSQFLFLALTLALLAVMAKNKRARKAKKQAKGSVAGPSSPPEAPADPPPPPTAPKKKAAAQKRSKPFRTPQTPHEQVAAADKTTEFIVEKIVAKITKKGIVHYEIKWRGFSATTTEPIAHLAGCSALLRGFEDATKVANDKHREEAILKAYKRKATLREAKDKSTAAKAERLADIEINGCNGASDEDSEVTSHLMHKLCLFSFTVLCVTSCIICSCSDMCASDRLQFRK